MEATAGLLRRLTMLRSCSDDDLAELGELVDAVDVDPGTVLIAEGDDDLASYLIVRGRASVRRGERVLLSLGAGEFIGEMANLNHRRRSATVVASSAMTLLSIPPENFRAFTGHPVISQQLTASLSERVRKAVGAHDP